MFEVLLLSFIIVWGFCNGVRGTYMKVVGFLTQRQVNQNELGRMLDIIWLIAIGGVILFCCGVDLGSLPNVRP